jgi:hypothetical protein
MRVILFVRSYANIAIVIVVDRVRGALALLAGIPPYQDTSARMQLVWLLTRRRNADEIFKITLAGRN